MTKGNVIFAGLIAFLIGGIGYWVFIELGLDSPSAGIASEAILVLLLFVWISSYFLRVIRGKMTFMEQRKRYRESYEKVTEKALEKKFDSMSEEEQITLIKELEIDKQ